MANDQDIPLPESEHTSKAADENSETKDSDGATTNESQEYENDDNFSADNCPPPPTFQTSVKFRFREPRMMFQNRMPPMGRANPMMGHFGPNSPTGPFPGLPNFQRARFQGHRPPPSFFQGPPRHFAPRQLMPPRSNNF